MSFIPIFTDDGWKSRANIAFSLKTGSRTLAARKTVFLSLSSKNKQKTPIKTKNKPRN